MAGDLSSAQANQRLFLTSNEVIDTKISEVDWPIFFFSCSVVRGSLDCSIKPRARRVVEGVPVLVDVKEMYSRDNYVQRNKIVNVHRLDEGQMLCGWVKTGPTVKVDHVCLRRSPQKICFSTYVRACPGIIGNHSASVEGPLPFHGETSPLWIVQGRDAHPGCASLPWIHFHRSSETSIHSESYTWHVTRHPPWSLVTRRSVISTTIPPENLFSAPSRIRGTRSYQHHDPPRKPVSRHVRASVGLGVISTTIPPENLFLGTFAHPWDSEPKWIHRHEMDLRTGKDSCDW